MQLFAQDRDGPFFEESPPGPGKCLKNTCDWDSAGSHPSQRAVAIVLFMCCLVLENGEKKRLDLGLKCFCTKCRCVQAVSDQ